MEKLIKSGSRMIFALEVIRKGLKPVTDRVWGVPEQAKRDSGLDDFEYLSGGLMSERATIKTKIIVQAIALAMAGAIGWAAVAQVDELTKGDARVIPSQQLQIVQSLDGGVVSEILVKDGQEVEAGQTLLKIDGTRATSGVNESDAQLFSLRAKQARLQALIDGSAFRTPQGSGSADEQRILQEERSLLGARQNEFQATLAVNLQQQDQRRQEQAEASARKDGAILLVVALTKGGLKMFNAEVSESAGKGPRIISGVLGLLFILMSVGMNELKKDAPAPAPSPAPSPGPVGPQPSPPAPTPAPQPLASNEPHLELGWRALNAYQGAALLQELPLEAQQTAAYTAQVALANGEDIFAIEVSVANDGGQLLAFNPEKLVFSLEGQRASVVGISHPRRLKSQRLAPGARGQGLVFVRANPLLGAALQIGQGQLSYADDGVAVSSNHQ